MAVLKPFAGIRPPAELAEKVAAPPYDVVDSEEARQLARGNPYSFLHVNKPEIDLDPDLDVHDPGVYRKGAENLQRFIREGTLRADAQAHYYLYRQIMGEHVQTGLVALASVDEYEAGLIRKHEFTRPDKEDDRVNHMDQVNAQVGPVFLTYRARADIDELIGAATDQDPEYDFVAEGVRHVFWVLRNDALSRQIQQAFSQVPCLYVADGHHRSAAAQRVRDLRRQANARHTGEESYNFFLTVVFPHEQMQILDYNRVVKDLNGLSAQQFLQKLEDNFKVSPSPANAPAKPRHEHSFGMYLQGQWYGLEARPAIIAEQDPVARLDVSILQTALLAPVLGIGNPRTDARIGFVGGIRGMTGLQSQVDKGTAAVAFACYPTAIENLMNIADAGQVMPPKSTWFEPKLKSGLVIHSLA